MLILCIVLGSIALAVHYGIGIHSIIQTRKELKAFDEAKEKYENLAQGFVEYVTPQDETNISPFNETLAQVADLFADRFRVAMTAATLGAQGAAARDLTRGLEELGQEEMPAGAIVPHLPKSLRKNPIALQMLNNIVMRLMQGQKMSEGNGHLSDSGSASSQVRFKL